MFSKIRRAYRVFFPGIPTALVPQQLSVYALEESKGAVFHLIQTDDQEALFILDKGQVLRLLDTLLDVAEIKDEASE